MGIREVQQQFTSLRNKTAPPILPLTLVHALYWIAAIYVGGFIGEYLFLDLKLHPGFIWPPVGVSTAAVYLYGRQALLPVAASFFLLMFVTGFTKDLPFLFLVAVAVSYTLQAGIAGAFLRYGGFTGRMRNTRDALALTVTALVVPMLTPSVGTSLRFIFDVLPFPAASYWTMVYAGGVFSMLVFTPTITLLLCTHKKWHKLVVHRETLFAFAALVLVTIVLFGTHLPQQNLFLSLYVFLSVLFWIGLRLGSARMVFAIFLVSLLAVAGILFQYLDEPGRIGKQLIATELFIALVAPLFFIMATLVDERNRTLRILHRRTKELENSLMRLHNADRSKNDFIAVLAHELRNPLAPVVSALEHIKMHTTDTETRELIALAEDQTFTMRHLLDDLLDVARITRRKFHLKRETVSVGESMQSAANTVRSFIEHAGHTLQIILPASPVVVSADKVRLKQIITNLLYNAAKYTERGGTIRLTVDQDSKWVHIHIEDNGIGIPTENLHKIFEPFHQAQDNHTAAVGTGLGIGLWLTKRLVTAHGGTILASSTGMGNGSRFTVSLPLARNSPQATIGIAGLQSTAPTTTTETSQRILLVDDNIAAASALQKLLEHYGHHVDIAHSGEEALRAATNEHYQVILLDIGLPDRDGYDVARTLTRNGTRALLVAITGFGQDSDKEHALQSGFHYHLTKPVSVHQVLALIAKSKAQTTAGTAT